MEIAGEPFWIVGEFRNGDKVEATTNTYKYELVGDMAANPAIHHSYESAFKESKRLARKFPGRMYIVFMSSTVAFIPQAERVETLKFGKAA